jgi:hypothetical protein
MQLIEVQRADGYTVLVNLDRIEYISRFQNGKEVFIRLSGEKSSVTLSDTEADRVWNILKSYVTR